MRHTHFNTMPLQHLRECQLSLLYTVILLAEYMYMYNNFFHTFGEEDFGYWAVAQVGSWNTA